MDNTLSISTIVSTGIDTYSRCNFYASRKPCIPLTQLPISPLFLAPQPYNLLQVNHLVDVHMMPED